jgi:diaminopimelate decarboxylase
VRKVVPLAKTLSARYGFEFFSIGGGLGIMYKSALESAGPDWWQSPHARNILTPRRYAETLVPLLQPLALRILVEPGRFIVGNAGILVTRVEYVKKTGRKNFVIVDAAMNDFIRPALYDSYHEIVPIARSNGASHGLVSSDVVGPVCESADYFAKDRPLPRVGEGDYLALLSAGAYGFVMASNYNSRTFAAEVLVNGHKAALVRARQKLPAIWAGEKLPQWLK